MGITLKSTDLPGHVAEIRTILDAAVEVIAEQGTSPSTADIISVAGISEDTLRSYFPTNVELLNYLYLALKQELSSATLASLPVAGELREQLLHVWNVRTYWAFTQPAKRLTLAQLAVSNQITAESRSKGAEGSAKVLALLTEASRLKPSNSAQPLFAGVQMEAMGRATVELMAAKPDRAHIFCAQGFEALWSALTEARVPAGSPLN